MQSGKKTNYLFIINQNLAEIGTVAASQRGSVERSLEPGALGRWERSRETAPLGLVEDWADRTTQHGLTHRTKTFNRNLPNAPQASLLISLHLRMGFVAWIRPQDKRVLQFFLKLPLNGWQLCMLSYWKILKSNRQERVYDWVRL